MGVKPHSLTRKYRKREEVDPMALVMDTAQFTVKELGLSKVTPATKAEWNLIHSVIREKVGE